MHYRNKDPKTGRFVKSEKTDLERFEEGFVPVTESGCWLWTTSLDSYGYGNFYSYKYKKNIRASRYSLELYKNEVAGNLFALHKCDIPACVNPDHLYIGTQVDNMQDRIKRNRVQMPFGENHHWTKLTSDDIASIKSMLGKGIKQSQIALIFSVNPCTISRISNNKQRKAV